MGLEGGSSTYYLDNFERILAAVGERYGDLLTAGEQAFADDLRALTLGARCLYVRLISRRGPYFRRDDLRYDEIDDVGTAIGELAAAAFLDPEPAAAPEELLPHLVRAEIEAIARGLGVRGPRRTKADVMLALASACDPGAVSAAIRARVPLVRLLRVDHATLYRLLFFGNLRQDWSELVLSDLGVFRYERYFLSRHQRLYPTRAAIDDALAIRSLGAEARRRLEAGDGRGAFAVAAAIARRDPPWEETARPVADGILLEVARPLERAGSFADALELYGAAASPPARERRARLLSRVGRERAALALCREIAQAPRDESERLFAARFEHRVRRGLGQVPPARRRYRAARRLTLQPEPGRAVEDLVLAHLAAAGRAGFHSENWLWLTLYGLALWDVVFAPVAGAFEHAYQDGPLDLYDPAFRPRREERIAARLAEIANGAWPASRLLALWHAKRGTRNRLVPWWPELPARLELALGHLAGAHLVTVLDRLSRDLGRYGRGLPDLFVVAPGAPGFVLYEVKSPGDRLRPEQIGWLDYLAASAVPCAVLAVEWSSNTGARFAAVEST